MMGEIRVVPGKHGRDIRRGHAPRLLRDPADLRGNAIQELIDLFLDGVWQLAVVLGLGSRLHVSDSTVNREDRQTVSTVVIACSGTA